MNIHVKCFAGCKDVVGRSEQTINVPEDTTVGGAFDHLVNMYPGLARFRSSLMLAVNTEYANREVVLKDDDELACIPPVSGGHAISDCRWMVPFGDALSSGSYLW